MSIYILKIKLTRGVGVVSPLVQMLVWETESMKAPCPKRCVEVGSFLPYFICDDHLRTKHVYLSTKAKENKK